MRAALTARSLSRWSQFPDVLLMSRQHGNRGRALAAMALENSTHPRNVRNGSIDARVDARRDGSIRADPDFRDGAARSVVYRFRSFTGPREDPGVSVESSHHAPQVPGGS